MTMAKESQLEARKAKLEAKLDSVVEHTTLNHGGQKDDVNKVGGKFDLYLVRRLDGTLTVVVAVITATVDSQLSHKQHSG